MSIDPKNMGNLTCGVVADPIVHNDKVVRLRVAADYAGTDSEQPDNKTGYFNVVYFLNQDTPNAKFVSGQIKDQKLKKGSQIQIAYRLNNSRRTDGDKKFNDVELIAEAITYAGGGGGNRAEGAGEAKVAVAAGSTPTEF